MTAPIGGTGAQSAPSQLDATDDAMSAVYLSLSSLRQNDEAIGQNQVQQDEAQQAQERAQQQASLQEARANQASSGDGFFGSVGHFFSDVATDLAHGHLGSLVDDASHDLDQAWNSPQFWNDFKVGMEDVAAIAGAVAATICTFGTGSGLAAVGAVAAITAVSATATAGAASARVSHFAATAQDATADATASGNTAQQLQEITANVLTDMKQTEQSHEHASSTLAQAIQTNDQTNVAVANVTVKG